MGVEKLFKKLIEPTIEIKTNWICLIGITIASLYGLYFMTIDIISDIKELF